jgi:hypothetical protein
VTTHSDALVSSLSEVPESIVICEREEDGTVLRRLAPAELSEWLERYRLGELWDGSGFEPWTAAVRGSHPLAAKLIGERD